MKYDITVRVAADEKVIDIPWEDVKKDYLEFLQKVADPDRRKIHLAGLKVVESRIHCVFLDRYKKFLIQ